LFTFARLIWTATNDEKFSKTKAESDVNESENLLDLQKKLSESSNIWIQTPSHH